MPALRCSDCGINWPSKPAANYNPCPLCGEKTDSFQSAEPIPDEEASSLRSHALFREWLEKETPVTRAKRQAAFMEQEMAREAASEAEFNAVVAGQLTSKNNKQVWCNGNTSAFQAEVVGSSPIICSFPVWSSGRGCRPVTAEVTSSNLVAGTSRSKPMDGKDSHKV